MAPQNRDTLQLTHSSDSAQLHPLGSGTKAPAPRAGLISHKAAQLVLMHRGVSSAQTPCKCNLAPVMALDKDHPSLCSPA